MSAGVIGARASGSPYGYLPCRVQGAPGVRDFDAALELTRAMPHQIERATIRVLGPGEHEAPEEEPDGQGALPW